MVLRRVESLADHIAIVGSMPASVLEVVATMASLTRKAAGLKPDVCTWASFLSFPSGAKRLAFQSFESPIQNFQTESDSREKALPLR